MELLAILDRLREEDDESDEDFDARLERETQRVLEMTHEEVAASLVSKGYDLDEVYARMRETVRRFFPKRWPLN